jgi:hypothetical protein
MLYQLKQFLGVERHESIITFLNIQEILEEAVMAYLKVPCHEWPRWTEGYHENISLYVIGFGYAHLKGL